MALLRIGDLARLGGVSVRTLRHYHGLGLLVPQHIDDTTGYRSYDATQLGELRRIVSLKELGVALSDIAEIVNGRTSTEQTTLILTKRRAAIVGEIAEAQHNLERIDTVLHDLTRDPTMTMHRIHPTIDVEIKPAPAKLVTQRSAVSESWSPLDVAPVIRGLYPPLFESMERIGLFPSGPTMAWYEDTDDGRVLVHATFEIAETPRADVGPLDFDVVTLPAVTTVAATLHHGSMDTCDQTYEALFAWIDANGYRPISHGREIDLDCGPGGPNLTEIQIAVEPVG